jgi:hypothetical protein
VAQVVLRLHAGRVANNMQRLMARVPQVVASVLQSEARVIFQMSQRLVPEDTGDLRTSGRVVPNSPTSVSIVYGENGPSQAYALAVHEHLSSHSPYSWKVAEANKAARNRKRAAKKRRGAVKFWKPGTGVKYLERPFKARTAGMEKRIGVAINSRLLRGSTNQRKP